jgi:hypothetical protein
MIVAFQDSHSSNTESRPFRFVSGSGKFVVALETRKAEHKFKKIWRARREERPSGQQSSSKLWRCSRNSGRSPCVYDEEACDIGGSRLDARLESFRQKSPEYMAPRVQQQRSIHRHAHLTSRMGNVLLTR